MGLSGLIEQERAPINHHNRTDQKVADSIFEIKKQSHALGCQEHTDIVV